MLDSAIKNKLEELKSTALVVDIETSAHYPDGKEINLFSHPDDYNKHAIVKWVGMYSYKYGQYYSFNAIKHPHKIIRLCAEHNMIIGFNSTDFDVPILKNNGYMQPGKYYTEVDCLVVLGKPTMNTKDGYPYKDRGTLMDYEFKNNSLKCVAKTMKLETQKGDIDYTIFQKNEWTDEETQDIKKYLKGDVMATKQMFDKLWDFWLPFAGFLDEKNIFNLSWIKNSISSLTYKSACQVYGVEPTYSERGSTKEEMGGRVIEPKYEEATGIWYVDFASLYPHIFSMFNLFSEVDPNEFPNAWHGNKLFKTRGHYDISSWNPLCKNIAEKIKQRIHLKKTDKDNPLIYTLKIFLNALYGASRSSIFEKIHSDNCGWDCCWLGQQIHEFTEEMMDSFGFETIAGDTDSLFLKPKDERYNNREYVKECLSQIIDIIKDNAPFPIDTFDVDIEHHVEYIMFPFSDQPLVDKKTRKLLKDNIIEGYKEELQDKKKIIINTKTNKVVKIGRSWVKTWRSKKKNYVYLYKEDDKLEIEIIGLPIKKVNATPLGMKIFNEVLEPQILKNKRAKFPKMHIDEIIENYLKDDEILKLLAIEYKIKEFRTYKKASQIQAQISQGYLNGNSGIISLIKNKSVGKAGLGDKYCTIEEAIEHKLTAKDLDLDKIYKELAPFCIHEFWVKNVETDVKYLVTQDAYDASRDILEKIAKPRKKVRKTKTSKQLKTKKVDKPMVRKVR